MLVGLLELAAEFLSQSHDPYHLGAFKAALNAPQILCPVNKCSEVRDNRITGRSRRGVRYNHL